jgi:hypothetical protein
MQGFYDAYARDTEIDMNGQDHDEHRQVERRCHADRRKKDRRKKEDRKASTGLLQPILTEAEIAALLRGAR